MVMDVGVESDFFTYKLAVLELMVGFAHNMGWVENFCMIIDELIIDGLEFLSDTEEEFIYSLNGELLIVGSRRSQEFIAEVKFLKIFAQNILEYGLEMSSNESLLAHYHVVVGELHFWL